MNPLEQAIVIAQRIVQIANSENLGDLRGEMIHETITEELMTSAKDPFRFVRACAVLQLLGIALVEILDEARGAISDPTLRGHELRRPSSVDDEFDAREGGV